jgi:hypothetical protein
VKIAANIAAPFNWVIRAAAEIVGDCANFLTEMQAECDRAGCGGRASFAGLPSEENRAAIEFGA